MIYCLQQYILGERECFSTYQTVTTLVQNVLKQAYLRHYICLIIHPMSSRKRLRRPYSCSGWLHVFVIAHVTLARPTRPPGVARSHVSEYASPFLSEFVSACIVVQNLRRRGMAQVSDYGWILISSALMILLWITRNPKWSNSCVIIGLIDGGDANVTWLICNDEYLCVVHLSFHLSLNPVVSCILL